jgi:uncharacterized protein YggE
MYNSNQRVFVQQPDVIPKAQMPTNVLAVEVNAMMNVEADSYLAIFHLVQLGQSAEEADSLISGRINRLEKKLVNKGIVSQKDFFPDMLSFMPVYDIDTVKKIFSKEYIETPVGFEIQKNLHIKFRDARVLDQIVTEAVKEQIYDLIKVEYFISNQQEVYAQLREKAQELMKEKVDNYESLGMVLEGSHIRGAEKTGAIFPLERYQTYRSNAQVSLASRMKGKGKHKKDIRRPSTLYYNKIAYSEFDIVENASITEPPVQFTYNITLHLELPPKKPVELPKEVITEETTKYIWLSEGEVKHLNLP